jgi:hypothetical protein
MIPLSDENPTLHTPWMTWLLIGTTVAVWMILQGAGSGEALAISVCNFGLVPGELTHQAPVGLAVPLGMIAAWKQNTRTDAAIVGLSVVFLSLPSFWLGLLFLLFLGVKADLFPIVGYVSPRENFVEGIRYLVMPVMTLALSHDHRAANGMTAFRFLESLRAELEGFERAEA